METFVLCVLAGLVAVIQDSAAADVTPISTVCGKVGTGTNYAEFLWDYPETTVGIKWYKGADTSSTLMLTYATASGNTIYSPGYDAAKLEPIGANNVGMKLMNLVSVDAGPYTVQVSVSGGAIINPETTTLKILSASEETSYQNGVTFTVTQDGTEQPGTDECPTGDFTVKVKFTDCEGNSRSTCTFKTSAIPASSAHTYGITNAKAGDVITMVGELPGSGITKTLTCTVAEGGGGGWCEIGCGGGGWCCIIGIVIGVLCLCGIIGVAVYCCKRSKKGGL